MKIALLTLFLSASVALGAKYPVSISTTNGNGFGTTSIARLVGKINTGDVTNAAGIRVAYLDDVVAGSATNAVTAISTNGMAVLGIGTTNIDFVNGANLVVTGAVSGATVKIGISAGSNIPLLNATSNSFTGSMGVAGTLGAATATASTLTAGTITGKINTGDVTNAAGSRVAYLSDTNGLGGGSTTYTNNSTGTPGTITGLGISTNLSGVVATATNINDVYSYVLSNAVAIGANGILLDRTFIPPATSAGHIAIGFGTTNSEIRPAKSITGNSVSFDRVLTFAHASGERVVWFAGDSVNFAWWGAVPSTSIDVGWALVQALYESGQESLWLDGSSQSYYTTIPIVASRSGSIRSIQVNAKDGYLGNGNYTNAYMLWNSSGSSRSPFSASAATDTITTPASWSPPANATNSIVIFYGINATNLPAPLSNGVPYFVHAYSATTMMVGLSTNVAEIVNITADGTGFLYHEVGGLDRMYLHDVYLHGQSQVNLNGIWAAMQQPAYWNGFVRCDNFGGIAFKFTGQDMVVERLQTLNCGVGLDTRGWLGGNGMQFFQARYFNCEQWTNAWFLGGAYNYVESVHLETPMAGTGAAVDGSLESAQLFVKNFYASQGSHTNTIFKMGVSGSFCSDYNIEQGYINVANDSIALLLDDQYKHRQIYANNSTNGAIRQFLQLQSIPPTTSSGISDMWSGKSLIGLNGRFTHFGMTYGPMVRLGAGTNDSTDLTQWLRSDGTTNAAVTKTGTFSTSTNYNASDFIPVVGRATYPMSNAVLYMVTNTKTNVISDGR